MAPDRKTANLIRKITLLDVLISCGDPKDRKVLEKYIDPKIKEIDNETRNNNI